MSVMLVSTNSDAELVERTRAGSPDAFAELFRRHWPTAWRAAFALTGSRSTAEDVAQDAFERALASVPPMTGDASFGRWVHRVAANRAIDLMRRGRRNDVLDDSNAPAGWMDTPGDARLFASVAALPADRRIPVVLRYWLDFTPTEIAETLGLPLGTVSSRIRRGLDQLRRELESDNE
jgi:RNA polymerase sigma-70 factor, ECF subfamily